LPVVVWILWILKYVLEHLILAFNLLLFQRLSELDFSFDLVVVALHKIRHVTCHNNEGCEGNSLSYQLTISRNSPEENTGLEHSSHVRIGKYIGCPRHASLHLLETRNFFAGKKLI